MNNLKRAMTTFICLSVASVGLIGEAALAADDDARVSITTQGLASDRAKGTLRESSRDEYGALTVTGDRNKTSRGGDQQKTASGDAAGTPNTDFWFYDAYVQLFSDVDRDGYFTGIELTFDADTIYAAADVYAVVYLSYEYGPWNEYAETEDFSIFGASGNDEYVIETDLVAGYPTGNYDILIELYDAWDGAFVAEIGPEDTSELSLLPLEDTNRDAPAGTTQIVVNQGGGGSLSWMLLLALACAAGLRRRI